MARKSVYFLNNSQKTSDSDKTFTPPCLASKESIIKLSEVIH